MSRPTFQAYALAVGISRQAATEQYRKIFGEGDPEVRVEEFILRYCERLRKEASGRLQRPELKPGELDPNHERARKERAMADKLELELEIRRGELVEAAAVDAMNAEVDGIIRSNFMSLPSRLANELASLESPREVQLFLDDEIRKTLTQLSDED